MSPESVELFDNIADHYEKFNLLASFGIERLWRKKLKKFVAGSDNLILDLGAGTGVFSDFVKERGKVIGLEPSYKMIKIGRGKREFINYVRGEGENLPFKDNTFDYVISAYVMRNLKNLKVTLGDISRVLRPGGKLIILEFFPPKNKIYNYFFKIYLGKITPFLYKLIKGSSLPVKYFSESIFKFMKDCEFSDLLVNKGFVKIKVKKLVFGISVYIIGRKN